MDPKNFYDYFEERPLSNVRSKRFRKTSAVGDPKGISDWRTHHREFKSSHYVIWYYGGLEGPERFKEGDHREAAWSMTAKRISRFVGDPGSERVPESTSEIRERLDRGDLPPSPDSLGMRVRTHHYYRVLDASELVVASRSGAVSVSVELTEEWHHPDDGIVSPIGPESEILGTHCVTMVHPDLAKRVFGLDYPRAKGLIVLQNSWGYWGHYGFGAISPADIDRFIVEGYGLGPLGWFPPVQNKKEKVILLWKTSYDGKEIHGREIVDGANGERIGWCFLSRRGRFLDIEELFVWPTYRGQGYGSLLAKLAREAANEMKYELRALVGFVDAYPVDRTRLVKIMSRLGLTLHPSHYRSLAFIGLESCRVGELVEPRFPQKPAAPMYKLDPATATRQYTVWFGTNRKPNDVADLALGFSSERDSQVHYGFCQVAIPKSHQFGSVGSRWYARWARLKDDRLRLTQCVGLDENVFWRTIGEKLVEAEVGQRQGLVFLHGYCNTFESAAVRAAQVGYDLRFPGETAFFSWPSQGSWAGYPADEAAIEGSERLIAQFLIDFAKRANVEKVHLIAHSMGNRGLLRALQRISNTVVEHGVRFGQIVLAAPDLDSDVFRDLAHVYPTLSDRTTLYLSPKDHAVGASRWLHGFHRVGLSPPVTVVDGVDTVEVPKFDFGDLLGHGYFAEAAELLHDIYQLIRHNQKPAERQRLLQTATADGKTYWEMEC
ncbi:MAG: alpha/beta hydrolase [Planctomycetaceae bacterium]|nr:alpha/beta hydrolase [Planctomycetaceae bacterium]